MIRTSALLALGAALTLTACSGSSDDAGSKAPLIVYSSRNEQLIKPVFDRYTQDTGPVTSTAQRNRIARTRNP